MDRLEEKRSEVEKAGEDLFNFAIDQEDGNNIDYFKLIKERLDMYITIMTQKPDAPEPAVVIGPEFARTCGNKDDVFTIMTGSRMFIATIGSVKEYLDTIKLR